MTEWADPKADVGCGGFGDWLAVNGEGLFDSRPWVRASPSDNNAAQIRFTHKGDSVYAYLLDRPSSPTFTIPGVIAAQNSRVRILGSPADCEWTQKGRDLQVTAKSPIPGNYALGVRITPEPSQVVKS